jgi:hypothetical protein
VKLDALHSQVLDAAVPLCSRDALLGQTPQNCIHRWLRAGQNESGDLAARQRPRVVPRRTSTTSMSSRERIGAQGRERSTDHDSKRARGYLAFMDVIKPVIDVGD